MPEPPARSSRSTARRPAARAPSPRALAERLGGEVVSADSAALYAGHPDPDRGARLARRGSSASSRSTDDVSVGDYQRLAHAAIDEILAAGGVADPRRRHRPLPARGARGARAAAAAGAGRARAAGAALRRARRRGARTRSSPRATRPPRPASIRTTAAASCARSSSPSRAPRSRPPSDALWSDDDAPPDAAASGSTSPPSELDARIEARARGDGRARASSPRRAAAWARPLSETARRVLGLEQFATLPLARGARRRSRAATRRLARYQRKWLRRLPVAATLDADRPPGEIADEIVALAGARERLPRR